LEYLDKNNKEEYNAKKPELEERRKIGKEKFEKRMKELEDIAVQQRKNNEKYVIDKSLKIDEEKNKLLRDKKSEEKNRAESDLYKFISNYDQKESVEIVPETKPIIKEIIKPANQEITKPTIQEITKPAIQEINKEVKDDIIPVKTSTSRSNNDNQQAISIKNKNEIFEKTEIIQETNNEIRQQSNFKVNLTEKAIPHFAARESLSKEPPYPKSKKFVPEKNVVYI
jgi:hypothetical protein